MDFDIAFSDRMRTVTRDVSLAPMTGFGVGGRASVFFSPQDPTDLAAFLGSLPPNVPLLVLGKGSNLLVRDGGFPGIVIFLGAFSQEVSVSGSLIEANANVSLSQLARTSQQAGISGMEFLATIPGSLGGALRMNAGCYGREMRDTLVWVEAVNREGRLARFSRDDLGYGYRTCALSKEWVFTRAALQGNAGDPNEILALMQQHRAHRRKTQPIGVRTAGSTFANPPGHKAWELIERSGFRGMQRGMAAVSDVHCNFLVNLGGACAGDIEALGEEIREKVRQDSGIMLSWEIERIGNAV